MATQPIWTNEPALRPSVSEAALNQLFRKARTHSVWLPEPVPETLLREAYDLARMAPTSANAAPARFVFLTTPESKERLRPALAPGNVEKTMAAPVVAIIAWDSAFYEELPRLFPHADMRRYFEGNEALIQETAFRNSAMQAAYFILAARAVGLDCGPMSGFDAEKINAEFFPDGRWRVNLLCNLGYGDEAKLFPRNPRLTFEEAARIF